MDDLSLGRAVRVVRIRRGWRQEDLAAAAGVSRSTVSRLERGDLEFLRLGTIRRVARELEIRVQALARWRGGDLDRLLAARHSALHEDVARMFGLLDGWVIAPEVTFSIYGERGAIDILAWHAATRTLLVIELKTEIVDVGELVATLDRKCRLATQVARERGWDAATVAAWVIVAEDVTNRRRVAAHRATLRAALPADGRSVPGWLAAPRGALRALSFWSNDRTGSTGSGVRPVRRVRRRGSSVARAS